MIEADGKRYYRFKEVAEQFESDKVSRATVQHWALGDDRYGLDLSDYRREFGEPFLEERALDVIAKHLDERPDRYNNLKEKRKG